MVHDSIWDLGNCRHYLWRGPKTLPMACLLHYESGILQRLGTIPVFSCSSAIYVWWPLRSCRLYHDASYYIVESFSGSEKYINQTITSCGYCWELLASYSDCIQNVIPCLYRGHYHIMFSLGF